MTRTRLVLLATTALTAMAALQFATTASYAQAAPQVSPQVVAQAENEKAKEEKEGAKKGPPGPPPKGAPGAAPPPPGAAPHPAAPPAPPPHPSAPPPPPAAAPKASPPPPAASPKAPPPPPARPTMPPAPPPPPAAAPKAPPPPPLPAAPTRPTPPPPPAPATQPPGAQRPATPLPAQQPPGRLPPPPAAASPTPPPPPPAGGGRTNVVPPPGTPPAPGAVRQGAVPPQPPGTPPGVAPVSAQRPPPTVTAPLPPPPPPVQALRPIAPGAPPAGPQRIDAFRSERHEVQEGGRIVITEPGLVIVRDPGGQAFVRHDEMLRFQFGARDIRTETLGGGETRTVVFRPDGVQIITVIGPDGGLLRRIRRDPQGREIVIIDNGYRDPAAVGGFYVDLPPPVVRIPYDHYMVEADVAPPALIYETLLAPPVDRIARRYSLDEIRYSPNVRQLMPSIDLNTINFDTGSWEIAPDQAAKLQVIADGLNRAIANNPREVFLIEGHTDATGNDVDNLSLSDRRAQSAAELLSRQFNVPAENLTTQGYGSQYLKEQTDGPSRINRRVTVRRITPLLDGGNPPPR